MFQDDLQTPDQTEKYYVWYGQMADAVSASLNSYLWVLGHVNERFKATGKDTHLAAALLLMEYADPIDGVAILARKGSARNCVPLIRTGFELQLNLMYMLQRDDTFENRCLAYEFFRWVKRFFCVAAVREEGLRYVGQLTRGFTASQAVELEERLAPRQRLRPVTPCPHHACWVEPELYCRVQGQGWTNHGRLRHADFRGLLE